MPPFANHDNKRQVPRISGEVFLKKILKKYNILGEDAGVSWFIS
jgi:hypothetical protein